MQQPGYYFARTWKNRFFPGQGVSTPASIANIFALLGPSTPGRYYLNAQSRIVYYVPRAMEDMTISFVVAPLTEVLLAVEGITSRTHVDAVKFLSFEGLTFSYASWLEPNNGIVCLSAVILLFLL